jgi:isochorismate synthase
MRTRTLGRAFDLLVPYRSDGFFLERSGVGVCAWGEHDRAEVPAGPGRTRRLGEAVAERLRSIGSDAAARPIAVGALPFAPERAASLAVPAHAVARSRKGTTVRFDLVEAEELDPSERGSGPAVPHAAFSRLQVTAVPEPRVYAAAVERTVARIREGALRKAVLARTLSVDAGRDLDPRALVSHVRSVDPDCYAFAAPVGGAAVLVGASPELLVRKEGSIVTLDPLAGSAPRDGDPDRDRRNAEGLLASDKDREEHAIVVEALAAALAPLCDELEVPGRPEPLGTANVWHLSSPLRGRLREGVRSVLDVVEAVHPTPAVGGAPTDAALATIAELEPFDRGRYAGPVGWVDAAGDGVWALALRCAELTGPTARLFAGAGIVAASDPALEVEETDRKFRALLDALRWG